MDEKQYAQEIAYWTMLAGHFLKDDRRVEARNCLLEVNRLGNERYNQRQGESQATDIVP